MEGLYMQRSLYLFTMPHIPIGHSIYINATYRRKEIHEPRVSAINDTLWEILGAQGLYGVFRAVSSKSGNVVCCVSTVMKLVSFTFEHSERGELVDMEVVALGTHQAAVNATNL